MKEFARTGSLGEHFNLVILDEMDQLTPDAQAALRRIMEDFSGSCRFVLCCNQIRKVITPIQSRCARFQFSPLSVEDIADALIEVMRSEGIEWEDGVAEKIGERADGSMRDALNILESAPRPLTVEGVERVTIDTGIYEDIVAKATSKGGIREAERILVDLIIKGTTPGEVFQGFFDALDARLPESQGKNKVLFTLGDYEHAVATGGSYELQARCFLRKLAYMSGSADK